MYRPPGSSGPTASRTDRPCRVAVVDASVLVDALVGVDDVGQPARDEVRRHPALEVPAIFKAEATSALRAMALREVLDPIRAGIAVQQVRASRTVEYPFEPFADRVWALRHNMTVYDAWYVAVSRGRSAQLASFDRAPLGAGLAVRLGDLAARLRSGGAPAS